MRGSVAAGYTNRNYDSALYKDSKGVSVQMNTDFFVTPLTTVGIGVQRVIQDSSLGNNGAYLDTRASVSADHALLRNLILSAKLTAVRQKLLETNQSARLAYASFSARYQSSRAISITGTVQYGGKRLGDLPLGVPFDEFRGQITLRIRR